jgi:hypothetical protein
MPPLMIPPLFAWMLGALGATAAVRLVVKEARRINAELDRVRQSPIAEPVERDNLPTLKRDPATGEYRPG